ncbi:KAP family NTPase [Weissella sp. LMG 11983]|uniref:KAP family NTPase n=1 Tax=Weissella sp. LMG 11983 TaxID=2987700 RepID=UPI0021F8D1EE|nr:KAP family NTPase [Weissella sp. LMG 11983]MCW0926335.1 KAP family NTPase [Weissella sp. LMG 11983]
MVDYGRILKDYIEDESDQFILQFNGSWGSGKTYFIEKFIAKQRNTHEIDGGHIYVSVSANGVGSIEEFKQRLTEKLIAELIKNDDSTKKLAFKTLTMASNILSSDGLNLILSMAGSDKKIDAAKNVGKNAVNSFANKLLTKISQQRLVLVVDDFEESLMLPPHVQF